MISGPEDWWGFFFDSMKSPAFRFYADDFFAGTADMSQAEVGAYIRLLCWQWNRGSIPVEPEKLHRLAGGTVSVEVMSKFPTCTDGARRNGRMEEEREKQEIYAEKQRKKGISSGESRRKSSEQRLNHGSSCVPTGVEPSVSVSVSVSASDTVSGEKTGSAEGKRNGSNGSVTPGDGAVTPTQQTKLPKPVRKPDPLPNLVSPWHVAFGLDLPENLRTGPCLDAATDWLRYKSEKKQTYKPTGLKAALTEWGGMFTAETFPKCVRSSMAQNYAGIFLSSQRTSHVNGYDARRQREDIEAQIAIHPCNPSSKLNTGNETEAQRQELRDLRSKLADLTNPVPA